MNDLEVRQVFEARMPKFVFGHPAPSGGSAGVAHPGTWVDHPTEGHTFVPGSQPLPDGAKPTLRDRVVKGFHRAVSTAKAFTENHPHLTTLGLAGAGVAMAAMEAHAGQSGAPVHTHKYIDIYAGHPNITRITKEQADDITKRPSARRPDPELKQAS